ncbi:ABC transporter permease [uncultured Clostridium sp.]|jgi:hypothetical protein|uniref:ABC transporter permease n=1 Tax=uncultured Clostridium sp. TaxID=59620 RepID=UPI002628993B|nr:ABC transporter permease [uncultured Clostridium sp.]
MLSKIKNNTLIKLIKHDIDKLSNAMILGFIVIVLSQLAYKGLRLFKHLEYQTDQFYTVTFTELEISNIFKSFFDSFYGLNITYLILTICTGLLAMYAVYSEFNKKNQSAYTLLTLPISKNKLLLSKVLVILMFFIIANTLMSIIDISFNLVLTHWMVPEDVDYVLRNLIYIIFTLQFEGIQGSLINASGAIGGGVILALMSRGTWKLVKIIIPLLLIGLVIFGYPILGIYLEFRVVNVLTYLLPITSIVLSFILFNKKNSI